MLAPQCRRSLLHKVEQQSCTNIHIPSQGPDSTHIPTGVLDTRVGWDAPTANAHPAPRVLREVRVHCRERLLAASAWREG